MLRKADIIFESGDYYVIRATSHKGFDVYRMGLTHAERCAQIGYPGDKGLERAKLEIVRRQSENR